MGGKEGEQKGKAQGKPHQYSATELSELCCGPLACRYTLSLSQSNVSGKIDFNHTTTT